MTCAKYDNLTHQQKVVMIGELVHCIQCDDELFYLGEQMIKLAVIKGFFKDVTILPDNFTDEIHPI